MAWLARQSFLGADSEAVLAGLTVGIVGLGGGGSHVSQQLAHVGIGNFVLVDGDVITDTNLNRLVGGTKYDVERSTTKVDIAARVIAAVNPDARVEKHFHVWQEAADALKRCDVIISAVDKVRAKHELDAFTHRFMIPYIDIGMDVHELPDASFLIAGQVILTGPGEPCLQCLGLVTDESLQQEARDYGAAGENAQVVWSNGVLASTAVGLLVQLVTPWTSPVTSAFLEYDGNLNSIVVADTIKRCKTQACVHYKVTDVGDPLFDLRKLLPNLTQGNGSQSSEGQTVKRSWWRRLFGRL